MKIKKQTCADSLYVLANFVESKIIFIVHIIKSSLHFVAAGFSREELCVAADY